jgi:beta-phosphoglucomutase-like phosphatase (HAD superfamily)
MIARGAIELAELLAPGRCILLDFDGPVCGLFRGQLTGAAVVDRLVAIVIDSGLCSREQIPSTEDSLQLLTLAHQLDPALGREINAALAQAETEAAQAAPPTPRGAQFIRAAVKSGRTVAIVSNNSPAAIRTYLGRYALHVDAIIGRTDADPAHLKPRPYLLHHAIAALAAESVFSTLIGDSSSDIAAARSLGLGSIGFANNPSKEAALLDACADVVVTDMGTLTAAMSRRDDSSARRITL